MMGVNVAWINERHEEKQEVFDSQQVISKLAMTTWPKLSDSFCLRFVDCAGDTIFNQAQIRLLLEELRSEAKKQDDSKFREHLEKVI
ncbi:hypothetical protein GCM10011282_06580 [Undibacterium macrobrachii]|uniref:Uncharacterized protein n=1 Tax=Undibacterium macrobrachii TaxID=1119058 RepID=A0ABQ2X7D2_9BURK|nr:hypothetical protein GCM10011282_06580 [Undibacterium macrobrachii]